MMDFAIPGFRPTYVLSLLLRCTIFSRQHVQHVRTVLKSLRIVYRRTPGSDTSTLRQGWCWNKSRVCQTGIISSQRQLFLDCVDRATEPSTAFASLREQPMHFNDNQTVSLRVVDPNEDDGVWAIYSRGVQLLLSW